MLISTQEVGRLQRERQLLEQQIADLFAFYSKQKQTVLVSKPNLSRDGEMNILELFKRGIPVPSRCNRVKPDKSRIDSPHVVELYRFLPLTRDSNRELFSIY